MPKVSAVMTAHREGMLAGMSIASFCEAIDEARAAGITVEPILILDRPDKITKDIFAANPVEGAQLHMTDFGDPALSRNYAAQIANGTYITYLDSDDLWSFNWITACVEMAELASKPFVAQSEMNWVFGEVCNFWLHANSTDPDFDPMYLAIGNYWDAMVFTWRDLILSHPIRANSLNEGYGHEDWHWHTSLFLAGIEHKPVLGTMHMKRRRSGSQMSLCSDSDVVPWPTDIYEYGRNHFRKKVFNTGIKQARKRL